MLHCYDEDAREQKGVLTCELLFTLVVSTESGPVLKSSSSFFSSSSTVGLVAVAMLVYDLQASPFRLLTLDASTFCSLPNALSG